MTEQTKAQRLADYLEGTSETNAQKYGTDWDNIHEAADELRRLDALNAELVEALEKLARLGNGDSYGNSIGNDIAIAALAKAKEQT
jgi:hypothetical protein